MDRKPIEKSQTYTFNDISTDKDSEKTEKTVKKKKKKYVSVAPSI